MVVSIQAEDEVIFSIIDPQGDDYGPGYYLYPQNEIFKKGESLFDLIEFKIMKSEDYYNFEFQFVNLIDVWNSRYGFSLPLIDLYIDNQKGGSLDLFEVGAQVRLNPDYAWDKYLKINGWWISLYQPEDKDKDVIDFSVTGDKVPWVIKDPLIKVSDNKINLKVAQEKIGPLKNSYLYVLIGGFDPFGYGHYRGIREDKNSWFFAAPDNHDLKYAPRVIDLIVPPDKNQVDILSNFSQDYPQIEPIYTGQNNGVSEKDYIIYLIIFLCCILVVYLLRIIIIKRSGVNNNADKKEQKTD